MRRKYADQNTERSSGKGDPGKRKYICHGRKPGGTSGYPSYTDSHFKSDAFKRRDRTAAPPFSFEYPSAGGRFFHDGKEPYF